jgi:hypothetical protein
MIYNRCYVIQIYIRILCVEANEPSIDNIRIKPGMQYATKLKAYPSNPAYDCVLILFYIL